MLIYIAILAAICLHFHSVVMVFACIRSVPASSPSADGCTSCTLSQLVFTPADANTNPQLGTVQVSAITLNTDGCSMVTVSCTGTNAGLLQFNSLNAGAPTSCITNPSTTCSAVLVCNDSGQWTFTESGVTTVITSVACEIF